MRRDIEETIRRSFEIQNISKSIPRNQRKKKVRKLLSEMHWNLEESTVNFESLSLFAKIAASRLIAKQIVNYGYSWLPESFISSARRIAITTPILMSLNMALRVSLIPLFFASDLPPVPLFGFALHVLATVVVHENEVKLLKKTPAVLNQYVSTLSFFFEPRLASFLFRFPTLAFHALLLFKPNEIPLISDTELDKALAAYYYYVTLWFLTIEGLGSSVLYLLCDKNREENS